MVCIYCKNDLSVRNSRPQKRSNQTWRRRPCQHCGAVFTSIEAIDLQQALAVQKNGRIAPFNRDTIFISIYESLRHRPSAITDARGISDTVIDQLTTSDMTKNQEPILTTELIRSIVLQTLERFDAAAASHYQAFHPQNIST